jgi:hypothetical protein
MKNEDTKTDGENTQQAESDWVQRLVRQKRFPHSLCVDYQWYRRAQGGQWVYYQTTLSMPAVWMKTKNFSDRLPCYLYTIKTENYSA